MLVTRRRRHPNKGTWAMVIHRARTIVRQRRQLVMDPNTIRATMITGKIFDHRVENVNT
jgi:hypothetical protein